MTYESQQIFMQALVGAAALIMAWLCARLSEHLPTPKSCSVPDRGTNCPKPESVHHGWIDCAAFFHPLMSLFLISNQCPTIARSVAFISELCWGYCRIKGAFLRLLGGACALPLAMEMNHPRDFYLPPNQCKKPLFSPASKPACK